MAVNGDVVRIEARQPGTPQQGDSQFGRAVDEELMERGAAKAESLAARNPRAGGRMSRAADDDPATLP